MKRLLVSICIAVMLLLNLMPTQVAIAQTLQVRTEPILAISFFGLGEKTITTDDENVLYEKLKNSVFPKVESILTPEQRKLFKEALEDKGSFRKAFKKVPLTSEQKLKLSEAFKAMPKDEILADLTPAQRKQLFLKKKELFMPSLEEITEKLSEDQRELVTKLFGGEEAK